MSVVYKWRGSADQNSIISLYNFLILHQNETFLKNMTITSTSTGYGNDLKIADGDSIYFRHIQASSSGTGTIQTTYTNGTASITEKAGNARYVYPYYAILSNNGLIISYKIANELTDTIGATMLTTDSTGHLCCALRTIDYKETSGYYGINLCVSDSQVSTYLNLSPTFNSSMTGLVPVVVSSASNTTTMPTFFVSAQTELPRLGLEVGAIDGQTYITNGYCFIRS